MGNTLLTLGRATLSIGDTHSLPSSTSLLSRSSRRTCWSYSIMSSPQTKTSAATRIESMNCSCERASRSRPTAKLSWERTATPHLAAGGAGTLQKNSSVVTNCRLTMMVASDIVTSSTTAAFSGRPGHGAQREQRRDSRGCVACPPQRSPGRHLPVSAGHVKKPDLLRMRPVEHTDRFGGGLQQYRAALLCEISLSFRR